MTPEQSEELARLSAQFTDADFLTLEADLRLRAACLGWTGDPLKQPADVVLPVARSILGRKMPSCAAVNERISECCGAPSLGDIADDNFGICAECKEHAEFLPECPKCDSCNTSREKFSGAGTIPECTYLKCQDCDHEWDHT